MRWDSTRAARQWDQAVRQRGSQATRQPGNHTNRHPGADPVDVAISLCAHRKFSLRYSGYRLRLECHSASWPTCNCIVYGLPHKRRVNSPPPSRCLPLSLARSSNGKFIWHANIFLPHIPFTLAAAVAVSVFGFRFSIFANLLNACHCMWSIVASSLHLSGWQPDRANFRTEEQRFQFIHLLRTAQWANQLEAIDERENEFQLIKTKTSFVFYSIKLRHFLVNFHENNSINSWHCAACPTVHSQ